MDYTAQIQIWRCENTTFYIGPIKASIFVHESKKCSFTIACAQFRCRGLYDSQLYMYTPNDPIIESSGRLTFAPYNFQYNLLYEHSLAADLIGDFMDEEGNRQTKINKWS